MSCSRGTNQSEAGFSLLEILVSLVLLSLTATLLTVSLNAGRTALNAVSRISAAMPMAATQTYLRQALAQAQPLSGYPSDSTKELNFTGTPQAVAFITSHAPEGQFEGTYRVEIGLFPRDRSGLFDLNLAQVLWRRSLTDSNPPALVRRATQLVGKVSGIGFAYFGDLDDNAGASWHNQWAHPVKLPTLVALDVTFAPGDPRRWERLILPVYAAESAAVVCPPRGRCR
jgi:general secretion pathway protein J